MGLAKNARNISLKCGESSEDSQAVCREDVQLYTSLLVDSDKKVKGTGKIKRFTKEQKELIENCFNKGEMDKRMR